ncbi:MAG TPA: hypothetical protein VLH59_05590 [Ignavibacteriaceae bacterium]|nr:hypothetical protein [Ignavibacteriaceae bacterium]
MIKLLFIAIVAIIFILSAIIIIRNKPDLWFWIFLNLYFDPGGYVYVYFGGSLAGPLHITDVFISGMALCLFSINANWRAVFQDQFLKRFLIFLFLFALYFYIVYGGIVPFYQNDFDYPNFLIKNRLFIYGIFILIAVYVFASRSLYYFYTTTITVSAIILTLFFITLITGIELIPVWKFARNTEGEMMRISMMGYGLGSFLFPISLITYLLSKKINLRLNYKTLLYYTGVVLIITYLLTLTRRTQIDIIGIVIIISLIIAYIFRMGKLSALLKVILPTMVVILVMALTFPKYVSYIAEIGEDTVLLITTGRDSKGESDQRVKGSNDYKLTMEYINNNLFFGTGYTYLYWFDGRATSARGKEFAIAADAAGEVPIYYMIFGFGLAGAILMLPLYFMMVALFFKMIRLLRLTLIKYLQDPLTIIFSAFVLLIIATKLTISLYNLSVDFTAPYMGYTGVILGIGFALYRKLQVSLVKENNHV